MKKLFAAISGFFAELAEKDKVIEQIIKLINDDKSEWVQMEVHDYGDGRVLRYEGEGEYLGTLIVFDLLISKIIMHGREYVYFLDGSNAINRAFDPNYGQCANVFSDQNRRNAFDL